MKQLLKICLVIWMILNTKVLLSQTYEPLAVENATWIMSGYGDFHFAGWAFRIQGDTLSDNIAYKKLYYYDLEVIDENLDQQKEFTIKSSKLFGLIRDDLDNKKVFFKPIAEQFEFNVVAETCFQQFQNNEEEFQLYDFSKTKGDTITDCMLDFGYLDPIVKLDTTITIYNLNRRALSMSPNFYDTFLTSVEGIGYTTGLFNSVNGFISAAKGYNLHSYCVGSIWECNLLTSVHESSIEESIIIYPNPISDNITIELNEVPHQIQIISIQGEVIRTFTELVKVNKLDLSSLQKGNYFLKIQFPNLQIKYQRFVKM